jgi:hypothetical protein
MRAPPKCVFSSGSTSSAFPNNDQFLNKRYVYYVWEEKQKINIIACYDCFCASLTTCSTWIANILDPGFWEFLRGLTWKTSLDDPKPHKSMFRIIFRSVWNSTSFTKYPRMEFIKFISPNFISPHSHNMSTSNSNIYKDDIDFAALSLTDPDFAKV